MLAKKTYDSLDRITLKCPDERIEFRFMDEKCYLFINGKEKCWVKGDDAYVNTYMNNILYGIEMGILMSEKKLTLKNKLKEL